MRLVPRLLIAWAASALAAACGSPIVGAECRDGLVICNGVCVDLASDPDHCGACEDSCGEFTCEDSECTTTSRRDGGGDGDGDGDGDAGGTGGRDAGESPIGTGNPFEPDAGFNFPDPGAGGCPIGTIACGGVCVDTSSDFFHCGGCGMACAGGQVCADGMCVDICSDPLVACPNGCFNLETDPRNCGRCSRVCPSGICEDGVCAGVLTGNVTVIGHDYRARSAPDMLLLASNAFELAPNRPIRALMYRGSASRESISGVRAALNAGIGVDAWHEDPVTAEELTFKLFAADALLIPAQISAEDDELIANGQMWAVALAQFLARGGAIVLFETTSSSNGGTFQILQPGGFFEASGRSRVPNGTNLTVDGTKQSIAKRVRSPLSASSVTVAFEGVSSPGDVVVTTPDGRPVVIHRTIRAP